MRIGIVIWSLSKTKGGIQRLGVNLAHAMLDRGHEPIIFYNDRYEDAPNFVYPVNSSISCINLQLRSFRTSIDQARAKLLDSKLDVLCAMFSWKSLLWFVHLLNNTNIPFIISEHNNPQIIENERWNRYERIACMTAADGIHLLNQQYVSSLPSFLHNRVTVIGNPSPPIKPIRSTRESSTRKRLLAVGRLNDDMKQQSLLISAFYELADMHSDWDLYICGDGEDFDKYEAQVNRLGLSERVFLMGRIDDIDAYYQSSHLYCIPSRYEGFPLVVMEAMAHGLPIVGFSQCEALHGLILHGVNGLLAEEMNAKCLAGRLKTLMRSPRLRTVMGTRAQSLAANFDETTIYNKWELLFQHVADTDKTQLHYESFNQQQLANFAIREILSRKKIFAMDHK